MTRSMAWCLVIATAAVVCVLALQRPDYLSDANTTLRLFMTHELLGFLGVIVTVTLASAGHIHLALNHLEDALESDTSIFDGTRRALRQTCMVLIVLLVVAVLLVVVKPIALAAGMTPTGQAMFNGSGLILVLVNALALADITHTTFKVRNARSINPKKTQR